MKSRLHLKLTLAALLLSNVAFPQNRSQAYLAYIDQYYELAVKQQKEYGIPASITLAQGLLESGAGLSSFTKESNNHFGIKCNDWSGDKVYHDDDAQGECFRKYNHVVESYEDHSKFLKNKSRYAFLFELTPTDYEAWAFGLKKAGYATDPAYGYKLISIIETYELHQFDLGKGNSGRNQRYADNAVAKNNSQPNHGTMGAITALISHGISKVNGVKFVVSLSDDNYALIADEFNMSLERLLTYNDLDADAQLIPGTRVFIGAKKNKAPKECPSHKVFGGESMRSISQDYGVKVVKLYKLNKMDFSQGVRMRQVLKLR